MRLIMMLLVGWLVDYEGDANQYDEYDYGNANDGGDDDYLDETS